MTEVVFLKPSARALQMLSYWVVLSNHILVCSCNFDMPVTIRGQMLQHLYRFIMPLCPWSKGPLSAPTCFWGKDVVQSILGLWATQGSRAAGSSCLWSFRVCREIVLPRGCSSTAMKEKHSPCCLHLHHCTYTLYMSELPDLPRSQQHYCPFLLCTHCGDWLQAQPVSPCLSRREAESSSLSVSLSVVLCIFLTFSLLLQWDISAPASMATVS